MQFIIILFFAIFTIAMIALQWHLTIKSHKKMEEKRRKRKERDRVFDEEWMLQGHHETHQIHVNQVDLTEFLYDCVDEFGEDPVWSERCVKNKQEIS